jgi:RNA polymerase sigma-70 factor (sigma-E family)
MRSDPHEQTYLEFVSARQTHLRRIAYAICGDWNRADDVLQTALTKLYVAWPRMQRRGTEEAYVRRIIVRTTIDEHRRPWRRESPGLEGLDPAATEHDPTDRTVLFDALQSLPVMQRKTVVLRHWLGLSVDETAHELGISQGTVKSHSARALARLQTVLTLEET